MTALTKRVPQVYSAEQVLLSQELVKAADFINVSVAVTFTSKPLQCMVTHQDCCIVHCWVMLLIQAYRNVLKQAHSPCCYVTTCLAGCSRQVMHTCAKHALFGFCSMPRWRILRACIIASSSAWIRYIRFNICTGQTNLKNCWENLSLTALTILSCSQLQGLWRLPLAPSNQGLQNLSYTHPSKFKFSFNLKPDNMFTWEIHFPKFCHQALHSDVQKMRSS